ncbi:uncharacterized protein EV154DRAFT_483015 [Mucor mucedo]|uniref:uncharacterized protein n=1 Tax=Mucor mucedo TaxID=29922 RepID=UPI00221F41D5|nr:uncharacterized protein EV154DRAFT_483015 [Mucor mucedo]KAI7889575.1 hypothetical protein EV154DRAFT_483015 [Mucor mucedo]
MICIDCHEEGYVNKNHFKCLFYREASANDVLYFNMFKVGSSSTKVIATSRYIRQIVIRAMIVNNYYRLQNIDCIPNSIFQQNYWYSLCQLVGSRKATSSNHFQKGARDLLTAACVEIATSNTNHVAEKFREHPPARSFEYAPAISLRLPTPEIKADLSPKPTIEMDKNSSILVEFYETFPIGQVFNSLASLLSTAL